MYNSLAQTGKGFSAFNGWYELRKLEFWSWVVVAIVFFLVIVIPAWKERRR